MKLGGQVTCLGSQAEAEIRHKSRSAWNQNPNFITASIVLILILDSAFFFSMPHPCDLEKTSIFTYKVRGSGQVSTHLWSLKTLSWVHSISPPKNPSTALDSTQPTSVKSDHLSESTIARSFSELWGHKMKKTKCLPSRSQLKSSRGDRRVQSYYVTRNWGELQWLYPCWDRSKGAGIREWGIGRAL